MTEWKSCNEVLKQIYFMSYQIRVKDAIIKVKKKFQYIDDIKNVRIILPGEYIVSRYEEAGENTDDNTVTLTNKKSGDDHDISKTDYYKIINSQ
ncbi:hypothetical protein MHK_001423 [Candidatus Magnetomorum sp. HK-1]|nr:hypothetical protein MHK_001423 [Candidatus Magnetomorum sp. HK-1]